MTAKLKQLEELGVIEKVNGPTSWINPLVAVKKPNGDIRICLDMRQANRAILRESAQFCCQIHPWILDNIKPPLGPNMHWQVLEVGY